MFLRRTKTVPWGPLVRFVPAFAFPKNKKIRKICVLQQASTKSGVGTSYTPVFKSLNYRGRCVIETWRLGLPAPLVARNHTRERVTGVDMVQNLLMLFCYFMYKIIT